LRNVGLDIIRAASIILIVISHTNNLLGKYIPGFKFITPLGSFGQEIFFSLSGFLIGTQLLKFINKNFRIQQLLIFYSRRWIRTIPFYFLFVGVNYFIYLLWYKYSGLDLFATDFKVAPYFTFTQNLFHPHPVFYPEIWPISIEEWSYLLIPLPLIFVCFISGGSPYRFFIMVLILMIVAINILRINYVMEYNPEQDWELRKIVVYRFDALLYGILLSVLMKKREDYLRKNRTLLLIIGLSVCIIVNYAGHFIKSQGMNAVLFTILPLFSALLLPYFRFKNFHDNKINRILTHTSLVSYAMLLSHLYFLQFLFISIFRPDNLWPSIGITCIYLVVAMIFSTLFYNFVERPVLRLRKG
jgi:peptidoglycan/LPS O-acetylase OafA/YrhL